MQQTSSQYDAVIHSCRELFKKKTIDYGTAWRILRLPSLTDQLFIKAQRIRGLQENEVHKVDEGEQSEFIGIVKYAVMALVQIELGIAEQDELSAEEALRHYDAKVLKPKP